VKRGGNYILKASENKPGKRREDLGKKTSNTLYIPVNYSWAIL